MRVVIQRVSRAQVTTEGQIRGKIGPGLLVLIAVGREDSSATAATMAAKIASLRIFNDAQGKMNLSVLETRGSVLVISQFTLYGDVRGQRRPSFVQAGSAELGKALYEVFVKSLASLGVPVETGVFQTHMEVEMVNDGPVTILVDSDKVF
jgi:D-tyrosyl-tRNA(Tyr) deacylase